MSTGRGRDARAAKELLDAAAEAEPAREPDDGAEPAEKEQPASKEEDTVVLGEDEWANPAAGFGSTLVATQRARDQLARNLDITMAALAEERAQHAATKRGLARLAAEYEARQAAWAEERAAFVAELNPPNADT